MKSGTSSNKFITIRIKGIERPFRTWWVKEVVDVDLTKHCIWCLKGKRYYGLNQESGSMIALPAGVCYYWCGTTWPYKWEDNFHIAFEYEEGAKINLERKGVKAVLMNAKEIPIVTDYIDLSLPNCTDPKFNTCRNWQFANYFKKCRMKSIDQ